MAKNRQVKVTQPKILNRERLLDNALSSVRLGIEDYKFATQPNGDPARALSSFRNLLSGVLLLFKYRISTSVKSAEDAAALIYVPHEVKPIVLDSGDVKWTPQLTKNTIETTAIQSRLQMLGIEIDWAVITKIKERRNELEHLHPSNTLGELTTIIAELFPVIRDFIEQHLYQTPTQLLGDTWLIMLEVSNFYQDTKKTCITRWEKYGIPARMMPYIEEASCGVCGSTLITPSPEILPLELNVSEDYREFRYSCLECNFTALISTLLLEALDNDYAINPFNGDEPRVLECIECGLESYVPEEDVCFWCEYTRTHEECAVCHNYLSIDEQEFNGLCSYHANLAFKDD
ncbi:hypothetical protein F3J37_11180 [Pantoea sp. Al-1710]|uniref:Uncharacterized protein n=1 Tax=Candidatus Pantoea communis TaxID=2608354 RepID=A0ABX0RQ72_9GAMM|nr:hypothetical protein [Pantoea communis]NIG19234.1 hypothetical protein [Pantoea communis]